MTGPGSFPQAVETMPSIPLDPFLPRSLRVGVVAAALLLGLVPTLQAQGPRVRTTAFGRPTLIEVLPVPGLDSEPALRAAREALATVEASFGRGEGNVLDPIETRAVQGPVPVAPLLFDLVSRAWDFCQWSHGAHGPLGHELYRLWGLPDAVSALPTPMSLQGAVSLARCDRMRLDPKARTIELATGSRLQLWGFAAGYGVDRAVAALQEAGFHNGRVAVGRVGRAFGLGPEGKGWPIDLPEVTSFDGGPNRIYLRDAAVAMVSWEDRPLEIAGDVYAPYLDQRTGRPPDRMVATVAYTVGALDAQALAVSLYVLGANEGQMLLGAIRPSPSILWVEGSRDGEPLLVQYRWSNVPRP